MSRNYLVFAIIVIAAVFVITATTTTVLSDDMSKASVRKKIHFTQTVESSPDPAKDQGTHSTAFVLSPNKGTLYDGTINYASSKPVKVMVLHQITNKDAKGQPIWTVDGETVYAFTEINPAQKGDSIEFTGSAVALRSDSSEPFTATVSVDGWIRGQPTPVISKFEPKEKDQPLRLPRTQEKVPLDLNKGFHNENELFYIITDTNKKEYSDLISKNKEIDNVNLSVVFSELPPTSLSKVYVFANGVTGNGIHGYQNEVFTETPVKTDEYSALRKVTEVKWKPGQNAEKLDSVAKIQQAKEKGRIQLSETETILNVPQIAWEKGKMQQRQDQTLDGDPYGGGQVLEIDKEKMKVTFIAHRGWGPDGKTVYYILTDTTPVAPAKTLGLVESTALAHSLTSAAVKDTYEFKNGIKGSGSLGFQPAILSRIVEDDRYTPLSRIKLVEWKKPNESFLVTNIGDLNFFKDEGKIIVELARPMGANHVINAPQVKLQQ